MTTDRSIETIDATTTNRVPPSTPTDQRTNDDDDDDDDASSHALTPIDPSIHPSIVFETMSSKASASSEGRLENSWSS